MLINSASVVVSKKQASDASLAGGSVNLARGVERKHDMGECPGCNHGRPRHCDVRGLQAGSRTDLAYHPGMLPTHVSSMYAATAVLPMKPA